MKRPIFDAVEFAFTLFEVLIAALVLVGIALALMGCTPRSAVDRVADKLPTGAENVQDAGNGWVTFEYAEQCFLFAQKMSGLRTQASFLTAIECPDVDDRSTLLRAAVSR